MQLLKEIIVDNFAGGGGASTGIELAIGRSVDIAINHDPTAVAMHKMNHPDTEHLCESVWDVDPRKVTRGRPVALCWFSPDCKHFSKAKGGKPVEKGIRGLAWVAVRWAATVKPRVIMLENVEEFKTWGPLLKDGKPDPKRKGLTFQTFVNALNRLGYVVDHRELRACDYGAPTIRKRFFLVARCDGRPIEWPKQTHGDPKSQDVKSRKIKPWRAAAEIIDWSIPTKSIFGRTKDLAENTLNRIHKGFQKFVVDEPNPFLLKTDDNGIIAPFIAQIGQTGFVGDNRSYSLDQPLTTIVSKQEHMLICPILIQMGYGERTGQEPRVLDFRKPLGTVTAGGNKFAFATAFIARQFGNSVGHSMNEPLGTVTAGGGGKSQLITAFFVSYYGASVGFRCDDPLHTITTKDRFGLVTIYGWEYQVVDIHMRMLRPRELFNATGFPTIYIIDKDSEGNYYPVSKQVAKCGNAVPPPFAVALVNSNLPELCTKLPYQSKHQLEMQLV